MTTTPLLNDEHIEKILSGIRVPPQPQVVVDIHMEQAMPNPDLNRIGALISRDVGLAGTIIKVVNSNLFGLKNRITSIGQAVQILGLQTVIRIIQGLSIKSEMSDEAISALGSFWDSATDVAAVAAHIARDIGYQSPDKAYCLGLFHNCGVPLLYKAYPDQYHSVIQQSYSNPDPRVIDVENQKLNTNHAVVGYFVAKSWGLPMDLCEVIAEHHSIENVFLEQNSRYDNGKKTLMAILKMAEHICKLNFVLGHQVIDYEWQQIAPDLLQYVGFSEFDFDDLEARMENLGVTGSAYSDYGPHN